MQYTRRLSLIIYVEHIQILHNFKAKNFLSN